jgi:hypothetical protein
MFQLPASSLTNTDLPSISSKAAKYTMRLPGERLFGRQKNQPHHDRANEKNPICG